MISFLFGSDDLPVLLQVSWKLLLLGGVGLLCYTNATQPMDLFGHVFIGVLTAAWFAMFLFLKLGEG